MAARRLLRRPLYPAVSTTILGLGLSAGIAVVTYVNGFFQPFPGADPAGLVRLFGFDEDDPFLDISYLDFIDYASSSRSFTSVAAVQPYYAASVRLEDMTDVAFLEVVSGEFFATTSARIALGRGLTAEDDRPGAESAAVLSHAWWQSRFNGDASILGTTLYLNYRPFTVVGVATPDFLGSTSDFRPQVWIPVAPFRDRYTSWDRMAEDRDVPLVRVYARLRDGVRANQASEEIARIAANLDEAYPGRSSARRLRLEPATWIDPRSRMAEASTNRLILLAAGGLLLLVCANVANLLLSVFVGRQRELAMHAALGASPARMLRQVLIENVLLALLAGGIALTLALPLSTRLGSYFARPSVWGANVSRELSLDLRVVVIALAISLLTGLAAGILPALRASRGKLALALKAGAASSLPSRGVRKMPGAQDALVTGQVALAVVLLVVAGLVLRTLLSVSRLDPGFAYEGFVASHVSTSSTDIPVEGRKRFFEDLADLLSREPWVRAVTVSENAPLSPHRTANLRIDDRSEPQDLPVSRVHPGFFDALDVELLAGRRFGPADTLGAPEVAIVNEPLADRFFPAGEAVGRQLWFADADGAERAWEVVGVVGPTKVRNFLAEPEPAVYLPYPQHDYPTGSALLVAPYGDPAAAVPRLQRWLRDFEPHLAIVNVLPYTEVVRGSLYAQRMNAELFAALAVLGLVLATVGIYAVVTLAVSRRTREIGVRRAVGARRADIDRLIVRQALTPVTAGLVAGLGISFAVAGLVRGLLHGVEPSDPTTLAAGGALILATSALAAYLPARRAGRVDPMRALRAD